MSLIKSQTSYYCAEGGWSLGTYATGRAGARERRRMDAEVDGAGPSAMEVEKDVVGPSAMVVESDSVGPSPIVTEVERYAQT